LGSIGEASHQAPVHGLSRQNADLPCNQVNKRRIPNGLTPCKSGRYRSTDLEKLYTIRFSEIARVLLFGSVVPVLKYAEAAASYAIAFRIVERFRRRIVCKGGFA
jgi:hypothetical protein